MHYIERHPDDTPPSDKRLSQTPTIHPSAIVIQTTLGAWTDIGAGCEVTESTLGDYSYLSDNVQMIYTTMGKFCSIASHVRINPGNHPMERVTQHHLTYRRAQYGFGADDAAFFDWRREYRCQIGHDVWIGHNAIIMPGVSIATGAVIGAGAVVTKDIGAYEIAVGIPARAIRQRFDPATIAALLRIAWWDWDRPTLEARFDDLLDLPSFIAKYDP